MEVFDFLQQRDINQLREEFDRLRLQHDLAAGDTRQVKELAEENLELKVRLGLLVQLLIGKGVFTAEEFAGLIAQTRPQ
jgi:hypothetical protein